MTVSYFVFYQGKAEDQQAFIDRYRQKHVPILEQFPGIRAIKLHTSLDWQDPHTVTPCGFALIVQMVFDSAEALAAALNSEARNRARADFMEFPPFHGNVCHQAMFTNDNPL